MIFCNYKICQEINRSRDRRK